MRALRSAPIGLVFFLLTLTYIDVGNTDISTRLLETSVLPVIRPQ